MDDAANLTEDRYADDATEAAFRTVVERPDDEQGIVCEVDYETALLTSLSGLTDTQASAVTHGIDPLLVLAGAGTGKTRVLTSRIAWLIGSKKVDYSQILAVTFTRKAAREMRTRLTSMLGPVAQAMEVGTFHSIAAKMLRDHHDAAGLPKGFAILDADDSRALIKECLNRTAEAAKEPMPEKVNYDLFINHIENLITGRPTDLMALSRGINLSELILAAATDAYQDEKIRLAVIDYSDILAKTRNLLRDSEAIRRYMQQQYRAILVDEYQDTNTIQQEWLDLITDHGDGCHLTCVGDDDQSVYAFRGADIANILQFPERFSNCTVVRLEENFRSTSPILNAANAVIGSNQARHGKTLFTNALAGRKPRVIEFGSSYAENDFIVAEIRQMIKDGIPPADIAVISRASMELGPIQMSLATSRIPFVVTAGRKFSQMQDVKTITSYLRILINPADDVAFQFILEAKPRGFGRDSMLKAIDQARISGTTLFEVMRQLYETNKLRKAAAENIGALIGFLDTINDDHALGLDLRDIVAKIVEECGLHEKTAELKAKAEKERDHNKAKQYLRQAESSERRIESFVDAVLQEEDLAEFVDSMSLLETETEVNNSLWLGTIHAAKGLEFPHVYLIAWEDGIFPSPRSSSPAEKEEETRLAYVAMTRAKKTLTVSFARNRPQRRMDNSQPNPYATLLIDHMLCEHQKA